MNRILYLDSAKIFVALLTIFAHLFPTYSSERLFVYSFHMPLFFLISGVFHNYSDKIQLKKYLIRIIIPVLLYFVVFSFVYIILSYCDIIDVSVPSVTSIFFVDYLILNFKSLVLGTDCSNVVLWFLYALFWCKLLTDIILYIKNRGKLILFLCFFLPICGLILYKRLSFFYLAQGIMALPFYGLGYFLSKFAKQYSSKISHLILALLLLIINVLITIYNGRVSMSGLIFGNYNICISLPLFYINALIGSIAVIILVSFLPSINYGKIPNSLISIMGLQMIFVILFNSLFPEGYNYLWILLYSIVVFFICHLVHIIFINRILKSFERWIQM